MSISRVTNWNMVVLVVDDDPIHGLCSQTFLGSETTKIVTATCGADALDKLCQHSFDLILLDFEMPDMNGVEFLHAAREKGALARLPVIVITQHRDPDIVNAVYDAGACDVFHKPVDWRLLAQSCKRFAPGTQRRKRAV